MKRKGHYTIVDTYNATEMYDRASFEDYCSACNEDGRWDVNSDEDWHEWAEEESRDDYDYFMDNMKFNKLFDYPVIVEGSLGLWWGKPEIEQRYFRDVLLAIYECLRGAYDFSIKKAGHKLEVVNMHHDGRNYFTITFLNPCGEARWNKNGKVSTSNRENFVKLPEDLF